MRLEELGTLKNPMTSSELEAATFRFVVLCLNQLHYRVPQEKLCIKNRHVSFIVSIISVFPNTPIFDTLNVYSEAGQTYHQCN
jgi:hypothetical protein